MGRRPKPTALKIVQGNPGKQRLPTGEPMPGGEIGKPPMRLPERVRAAWEELAPLVWWASESDRPAFERLARDLADLRRLDEVTEAPDFERLVKGSRGLVRNPILLERRVTEDRFDRRLREFGLTPASRARVAVAAPESAGGDLAARMMRGEA